MCWLAKVVLECVQQLEQFLAHPLAIAVPANSRRLENTGRLEMVERGPCGSGRNAVSFGRAFGANDGLCRQTLDNFTCD